MTRQPVQELFDALSDQYGLVRTEVDWSPRPHLEDALRLVSTNWSFDRPDLSGISALDVGCGPGFELRWLRSMNAEVTGVDASAAMVARAQIAVDAQPSFLAGPATVHQAVLPQLPDLDGKQFHLVYALGCMEFVPEIVPALDNLRAMVKPGGVLLVTVERCGTDCPGGESEITSLMDDIDRYRLTRNAAHQWVAANGALTLTEVPGYLLESGERVQYYRILGRPG